MEVSIEVVFRMIEGLTNHLLSIPPSESRGKIATPKQWEAFFINQWVPYRVERVKKYNHLPEAFQERFHNLEVDWTKMFSAEFLSEAKKCKDADQKAR